MRTPTFPILMHSKRFVFRDFTETDRADFVACQMDERYRALYDHPDTDETREHSNALFDRFVDWQQARPRRNFQIGIFDRTTAEFVGCTGLRCRETPLNSATFGIELAPAYWGRYHAAIETAALMIAESMLYLICIILFVFGVSFGKAQRAERCGASVKRCNAAKRRQNQTLRAGTAFRPAASRPLTVAPLRSAALSLRNRRLSSAKWGRLNTTCFKVFRALDLVTIIGDTASGNRRIARLARWFGAEITAERAGPDWMADRGWTEVDWSLHRHAWETASSKKPPFTHNQGETT